MKKEEVLALSKKENKGKDIADLETQKKGALVSYFVGVCGIIIVDVINGLVFHDVNHGPNMIICLMAFVAFLLKYITLKKKHELAIAICYGLLTIMFMVFWILQLCKIW